eukprot:120013-Amphidinium_carterae.1
MVDTPVTTRKNTARSNSAARPFAERRGLGRQMSVSGTFRYLRLQGRVWPTRKSNKDRKPTRDNEADLLMKS